MRGEQAVAQWYEARGFEVAARNWRSRTGEIDLVLRLGQLVVICEVKTRSSERFGAPVEAVTPAKARRIRRLSAEWLAASRASGTFDQPSGRRAAGRGTGGVDVRFDVASVMMSGGDLVVDVMENAF